jgi:DNA polymerase elongation subunit (family B)
MNEYLNEACNTTGFDFIIASDTDSMYINLAPWLDLVKDFRSDGKDFSTIEKIRLMDGFCKTNLDKFINESYDKLYNYINAFAPKMSMKREALADAAIWTGKKHYMLNVYNQEGVEYEKPKLKVVGLQAVMASSLSVLARKQIKQAYEYIIGNNRPALLELRDKWKEDFNKMSVEEIALPKSCNGLVKYAHPETIWGIKTPYHTKGALIYNNLLDKLNLTKRYPKIKDGEKVRYVALREPNDVQSNVISFAQELPKEFDLHQYVDYDVQFSKTFTEPVELVMNAIDWHFEERNSLENFWS